MKAINTILAALDLGAGSDVVLARAVQIANAHAARLIVLHVIEAELLPSAAEHLELCESELRNRLKRDALAAIEALVIKSGRMRRTDIRVEVGSPYNAITHITHERFADLVLVGSGKSRTLKDKILGSTADKVIRTSVTPVLVVRKPSAGPYRSVAVAIDNSSYSAKAFTEARRLVPDAAFQLLRAVGIPVAFQRTMLRVRTSQAELERCRAARADKAREELLEFQRDILKTAELPMRILDGEPGPALVGFSKSKHVDLIALGSRGRGVVLQVLLGSVARQVLAEASCDVLIASI